MAYPEASVKMTMAALEARDRCEALAKSAGGMTPQQFRKAFDDALGDLQFHL